MRCQLPTLFVTFLLLRSFLEEAKRIIIVIVVVSWWLRLSGLFPLNFSRLLFLIYNSQRIISATKSIQHVIKVVCVACCSGWLRFSTTDAMETTLSWFA